MIIIFFFLFIVRVCVCVCVCVVCVCVCCLRVLLSFILLAGRTPLSTPQEKARPRNRQDLCVQFSFHYIFHHCLILDTSFLCSFFFFSPPPPLETNERDNLTPRLLFSSLLFSSLSSLSFLSSLLFSVSSQWRMLPFFAQHAQHHGILNKHHVVSVIKRLIGHYIKKKHIVNQEI